MIGEHIVEFCVVGDRAICRFDDLPKVIQFSGDYATGAVSLGGSEDIRDIEVINLDGLSEAEALRILGVDEKGNDLRALAAKQEQQKAEQAKAVDAMAAIPELKALHEQFVKLQAERVTAPFVAEVAKLNAGYLGGIDREIANEKKAGHLDGVIALEAEKKLIQGIGASGPQSSGRPEAPAPCPIPAEDDEKTVEALKKLRGIYRDAYAKIEAARAANLKGLTDPLIVRLKQLVADLTRQDRVADAKSVREYREALEAGNAGGLAGNVNAGGQNAPSTEADESASAPARVPALVAATKDKPFINSLGMKFVPVPDTDILMCIHETRYKDYAAYDADVRGVQDSWKDQAETGFPPAERSEDHPVTKVTWDEAKKFCEWLGGKEGVTVRLPTDREWSYAVGIGRDEDWKDGGDA